VRRIRSIHQLVGNAGPGNSISAGAFVLRSALREWGYDSEIFAETVAPAKSWDGIKRYTSYRAHDSDLLILHYTQASPLTDFAKDLNVPLVLVYHNVTPPHYYVGVNPGVIARTRAGLAELSVFRDRAILALGDSEFNQQDLAKAGYEFTGVVPVIVPELLQRVPPDQATLDRLKDNVNLLSVGRLVPNKCPDDVIKAFYYYQQIEPEARLYLVGHLAYYRPYISWLEGLVSWLGLQGAVTFTDHISEGVLAAYYRAADAFVYMSEHEGFGIPLVESMRFGVPIIAYESTAVPETLGGAGILVREKRFPVIAELIHLLRTDSILRDKVLARQRERAMDFAVDVVLARFHSYLETAIEKLR
jgi:glycosyltransferase involved in cell wall biosynthesis